MPKVTSPSEMNDHPKECVHTYNGFDAFPAAYQRVFEEIPPSDFHATLAWYSNFVRSALSADDHVRLYCVENQDPPIEPAALLPMKHRASYSLFAARELSSLTNYYTCLFEPLLSSSADLKICVSQLANAIRDDRPRWDVLRIAPMAFEHAFFVELREALSAVGFATQEFFCFGNWYLPVEGRSYKEYLSGRPSVLQNTLRRKAKKLEQSGRASIEIVRGNADIERAIEAYNTVYRASWKIPEPYPDFVPGLIRTCAERDWLRLGLVFMDGTPIAAQLWIVQGGVASIYKLAYDEQFAVLSAGTILTARLMEHALDVDRVREVDYLSGDDNYKQVWMSHRRERWGLLAFNRATLKGAISMARHVGGRKLKRALQRIRKLKASPVEAKG